MRVGIWLWVAPLLFLLGGCGGGHDGGDGHGGDAEALEPVRAERVWVTMGTKRIRIPGTVEAYDESALSSRVNGVIVRLQDEVGASFSAGEVLVEIDAEELRARVEASRARLREAEVDYQRIQSLYDQNAVPEAQMTAATSRLETSRADLKEAETLLGYLEIRAPFDGQISRVHGSRGDLAGPGMPLLTVMTSGPHQFSVKLPESLKPQLDAEGTYEVWMEGSGAPVEASVEELAQNAEPASRTYAMKLKLPDLPRIRPGSFGYLEVDTGKEVLLVDPEWVITRGQLEFVYVLADGQARLTVIRTGSRIGDDLEVVSGLTGAETLLVPSENLRDGSPVL